MKQPLFQRIFIVGVGQIGASLGLNFVSQKLAREVIGLGRDEGNLKKAVRAKAIHRFELAEQSSKIFSELSSDDLVILATPVKSVVQYLKMLNKQPLVIDVGSTKSSIMKEAKQRRLRFIGCHPIAGIEKSGADAGDIHLFQDKLCLVTPSSQTSKADLEKIRLLWKKVGAKTEVISATEHDRIFAATSHLPHVAAYSLMQTVGTLIRFPKDLKFVFGSLRGTTRIAASPPEMWRDIFLENRLFVLKAIDRYIVHIQKLRSYIKNNDSRRLMDYLQKSQNLREELKS